MSPAPPAIDDDGWGHITVAGSTYKDVKLWPGGARSWDWTEHGTDHTGGIQPGDVRELLDNGAAHVILSRGRQRRLQVARATGDLLTQAGAAHEILETGAAISRYMALRDAGVAVGALIHTTC